MSKLERNEKVFVLPHKLTNPPPHQAPCKAVGCLYFAGIGCKWGCRWAVGCLCFVDGLQASRALQIRFRPAPACVWGYWAVSSGWTLGGGPGGAGRVTPAKGRHPDLRPHCGIGACLLGRL